MGNGPIDPGQRRLAERRLLTALRRHQRTSPLRRDLRVDALVGEVRAAEPSRVTTHRGRQPLTLSDRELRSVVDTMVAAGALMRTGHRLQLPEAGPSLDPIMRERVDQLLAALAARGATPPSADALAVRLGIPPALVDQLRGAGELVPVAPRIDYPREAWLEISHRLDRLAADDALSVRQVRDELGTARRHAEAILRHWNRSRTRDTRGVE
ncbi:MAG: hypothetical protein WD402_10060 [Chloroflexota bacterium]